jgi:hypothetical protein
LGGHATRSSARVLRRLGRPRLYRDAVGLLTAAIVGLAVRPTLASGPQLELRAPAAAPTRVEVYISSPVPLGAYTLQFSFDPAKLELLRIAGGRAEFAAAPFANRQQFSTGKVRFSALQSMRMDGPTGVCHVATLTFRPRVPGGRTRIEVEAITLSDTRGSTYHPPKRTRTLRLQMPRPR